MLVSHRDISAPQLGLLDFGEGFPVVLDDETGSQPLVVLVPQMGEGSRVVRVIGVIVRKRLSLGEVARLPGRVHLRDHLYQVTEHGADLLLRRALPPLVEVAHHAFRVHLGHIDAEKIQALEVADLAIEILKLGFKVTISNEIDHLFVDDVCTAVYLPCLSDAFLGSTLLLGLIGNRLQRIELVFQDGGVLLDFLPREAVRVLDLVARPLIASEQIVLCVEGCDPLELLFRLSLRLV